MMVIRAPLFLSSRFLFLACLCYVASSSYGQDPGQLTASSSETNENSLENSATAGELYSPVGKRDPFKVPTENLSGRNIASVKPLEKYSLQQLNLRAILRGLGTPRALFQDPTGQTYVAQEGDAIGRERATVSRILESEVIVTEKTVNYLGKEGLYERVISLPNNP